MGGDSKWAASNLLSNLSTRTSGNDLEAVIGLNKSLASFESCFKTTDVELASADHKLVLTFDLTQTLFVHAILLVEDLTKFA